MYPVLKFGETEVTDGKLISYREAQQPMSLTLPDVGQSLMTVIFFDDNANYLQLLVVNGNQISVNYEPPNPSTGIHGYRIFLLKQNGPLPIQQFARQDFPLDQYIKNYQLTVLAIKYFLISGPNSLAAISPRARLLYDNPLSEKEQAYCRCLVHVKEKDSGNPYAICHKQIPVGQVECSIYYDFDNFTDNELRGYARDRKIAIPEPFQRNLLIQRIRSGLGQK